MAFFLLLCSVYLSILGINHCLQKGRLGGSGGMSPIKQYVRMYKNNDMVYARCTNYPYWPGKVINVNPKNNSYKVLFYGEKSQAVLKEENLMPFTQENTKMVLAEGNNSQDGQLRRSIQVATGRYRSRKRGNMETSDEEECHDSDRRHKEDRRALHKPKQMIVYKTPDEPHHELAYLLNLFSNQISAFDSSQQVERFGPDSQRRLAELLSPEAGLLLPVLIDLRVVERMMLLVKEMELWGMGKWEELGQLVKERYMYFKAFIMSEQFATIPLREVKRDLIVQKVTQNKAVLH